MPEILVGLNAWRLKFENKCLQFLFYQNRDVSAGRRAALRAPFGCVSRIFGQEKSSPPDDLDASELINEELSDSVSFYSEKARYSDELVCGRLLQSKSRLEERENRHCLNRIFTTGLPKEDAGGYYSEKHLKTHRGKSIRCSENVRKRSTSVIGKGVFQKRSKVLKKSASFTLVIKFSYNFQRIQ